ncbi:Trypsin-like peptidase domain-containing protein [Candidatus Electrothrix laxa]
MSNAEKELPSSDIGKYIQLFGLLLALGVAAYFYMKKEGIGPYAAMQSSDELTSSLKQEGAIAGVEQRTGLSAVDQVRLATVSVRTSWGRGTGFFIRKNFIVTCKHVVEPDFENMAALQEQVQRNRQLLDFEEKKLNSYRVRLKKVSRGSSKDGLKILILERERYLADFKARQEKDELDLAEQKKARQRPAIQILLSDGSEQSASLVQISQTYDLALLTSVAVQKNSVLEPSPPGALLRLGDPIFVSGSSTDPEKSVTTGVFSGYRRIGLQNQMFLQIDPEIFLDKSDGPVVDAAGYVRGIVTGTVRKSERTDFAIFAIPVERVFDEFSAFLE